MEIDKLSQNAFTSLESSPQVRKDDLPAMKVQPLSQLSINEKIDLERPIPPDSAEAQIYERREIAR